MNEEWQQFRYFIYFSYLNIFSCNSLYSNNFLISTFRYKFSSFLKTLFRIIFRIWSTTLIITTYIQLFFSYITHLFSAFIIYRLLFKYAEYLNLITFHIHLFLFLNNRSRQSRNLLRLRIGHTMISMVIYLNEISLHFVTAILTYQQHPAIFYATVHCCRIFAILSFNTQIPYPNV